MLTDKEILIKSVEKYASTIASKFFKISGIGSDMLIKIAVKNVVDKYGNVLELFIDKEGNIPSANDLFEAFKNIIEDRDGIAIGNIKFTKDDVSTLENIFNDIKAKQ